MQHRSPLVQLPPTERRLVVFGARKAFRLHHFHFKPPAILGSCSATPLCAGSAGWSLHLCAIPGAQVQQRPVSAPAAVPGCRDRLPHFRPICFLASEQGPPSENALHTTARPGTNQHRILATVQSHSHGAAVAAQGGAPQARTRLLTLERAPRTRKRVPRCTGSTDGADTLAVPILLKLTAHAWDLPQACAPHRTASAPVAGAN
jgi:hypothetical protein